jgi:DNA-binding beta-propeller fold protein YncE
VALLPWRLAAAGAALLAAGCRTSEPPAASPPRVWPSPPAAPRIAFVQSLKGPADAGARLSSWRRVANFLTGSDRGLEAFVRPQGVALDEQGNLCLADPGAPAVCFLDRAEGRFLRWQRIGDEDLVSPVAIARRNGVFFVADTGLGKVLAFDDRGRLLFSLREGLQRPAGVAASADRIFVADAQSHEILVYDHGGRLIRRFGSRGTGPGQFNVPTHVALDAQGRLYVTDSMNFRVQIFDAAGEWVASLGAAGDSSGHFSRPKGVAVDSFGHIFVVDALFDNVQVFDDAGRFLMHWGEAGQEPGEFWLPAGIAADHSNRLYIADAYNGRVQVFQYVGEE